MKERKYIENLKQDLSTWRWYEYDDKLLLVNLQLLFFDILNPFVRMYFILKRKLK